MISGVSGTSYVDMSVSNGTGTSVGVTLNSLAGRIYQRQRSDGLNPAVWTNIGGAVMGPGTEMSLADPEGPFYPKRFYRLAISP